MNLHLQDNIQHFLLKGTEIKYIQNILETHNFTPILELTLVDTLNS